MGKKLVDGADGLPAEEVGQWVTTKHGYLTRYIDIARSARKKYIGPGDAGATFIDPFCGPGQCFVRETGTFVDGGVVAAWKASVAGKVPFSQVIVSDLDPAKRNAAAARLRKLGAPVIEFCGPAQETIPEIVNSLDAHALHFAYLDPFDLRSLSFKIIANLATLKR